MRLNGLDLRLQSVLNVRSDQGKRRRDREVEICGLESKKSLHSREGKEDSTVKSKKKDKKEQERENALKLIIKSWMGLWRDENRGKG